MKKVIYVTMMAFAFAIQAKAQLPLQVNFDNGSFSPLQLRYGPNDNPAQQDTNYTVRVQNSKAHFISPSSSPQIRLSGFLDLPSVAVPVSGSMNHRWTFTNVNDFNVLGVNAVAGCYIRGDLNHWAGGVFGDYWFGMIVTTAGRVSGIRQGSVNLQTEPFIATDSVSYEVRKIDDSELQLWVKYDTGNWHQVGNKITITLNTLTAGANFDVSVTHVRILNNNGNAVNVSVDNMLWWQPTSTLIKETEAIGKINIYPNPASNKLFLTNLLPKNKVRMYDVTGKEIICSINGESIDISNLIKGAYYLKIFNDKDELVSNNKIIKL
jgi:hypothetical protein